MPLALFAFFVDFCSTLQALPVMIVFPVGRSAMFETKVFLIDGCVRLPRRLDQLSRLTPPFMLSGGCPPAEVRKTFLGSVS